MFYSVFECFPENRWTNELPSREWRFFRSIALWGSILLGLLHNCGLPNENLTVEHAREEKLSTDHRSKEYDARSIEEIVELETTQGPGGYHFQINARLAFAARHWNVFYIFNDTEVLMVHCTGATSERLYQELPGTWLRIEGYTSGDFVRDFSAYAVHVDSSPSDGNMNSEASTESSRLETIGVHQIQILPIEVLSLGKYGTRIYETAENGHRDVFVARHFSDPEMESFLGRTVSTIAMAIPNQQLTERASYQVRVMQNSPFRLGFENEKSSLELIGRGEGRVIYSDKSNTIVVLTSEGCQKVITKFAASLGDGWHVAYKKFCLKNGDENVRLLTSIRAEQTEGSSSSIEPRAISKHEDLSRMCVSNKVKLVATLNSLRKSNAGFEGELHANGERLRLFLCSQYQTLEELRLHPKDLLQVTGAMVIEPWEIVEKNGSRTGSVSLYVQNPSDITLIESSFRKAIRVISYILCAGLAGLFVAIAWASLLRRQVGIQTKQLSKSNAQLHTSFDSIHEGIAITDRQGTILTANKRFSELTNVERAVGCTIHSIFGSMYRESATDKSRVFTESAIAGALSSIQRLTFHTPERYFDFYANRVINEDGQELGTLYCLNDVTERVLSERKAAQAQKLEALGMMAGRVAHDLNNWLAVIRTGISVAKIRLDDRPLVVNMLGAADMAAKCASGLTEGLVDTGRARDLILRSVEGHEVLADTVKLAALLLPPNAKLEATNPKQSLPILVDKEKLVQVLLNLIINAAESLDGDSGTISVGISMSGEDKQPWLEFYVHDTGKGIPPEHLDRIFEPFFSTKEKGTGLGLAIAKGLVTQMNGRLHVSSELGKGSIFTVGFLACDSNVQQKAINGDDIKVARDHDHPIRILVRAADPLFAETLSAMLVTMGYEVVRHDEATDYALTAQWKKVDLLLMDASVIFQSSQFESNLNTLVQTQLPAILFSGSIDKMETIKESAVGQYVVTLPQPFDASELVKAIQVATADRCERLVGLGSR